MSAAVLTPHTTHHELEFLRGLGCHSTTTTSRRDLLLGYRSAMPRRTDWGAIDRQVVARAIESVLEERKW